MTTVITIFAGIGVSVLGIMLLPLSYAVFGDEIPGWVEEWGPLASVSLALAGGIGTLVSVVLLAAQAVSG